MDGLPGTEVGTFKCHICGNTTARSESVGEVFMVDSRRVLVEQIPVQVYERCGEPTFSRETTERIRWLVHEVGTPLRTIPLEVFALA